MPDGGKLEIILRELDNGRIRILFEHSEFKNPSFSSENGEDTNDFK